MRRMLVLLLVAFTLIPLATPHAEAQGLTEPIIQASREVAILNSGLLAMNDTFTLEAPRDGRVQVTSLKVGFNAFFTAERCSFEVWEDGGWRLLEYEEVVIVQGFHGYEVRPPSPVVLEGDRTLKIRASYLFVNRVSWSSEAYSARIPVYPAVPHNISSFALHVTLPEGAELRGVDVPVAFTNSSEGGLWTLGHEAEALIPLRNENVTITYTPAAGDEYLLDCDLMQRGISILPGKLKLEDTYAITNRGATIQWFHLKLPGDASNVKARDGIGPLDASSIAEEDGDYVDVHIVPRSSVAKWNRWAFTVEYSLPRSGHIEGTGGGFALTYPAYGFPHYVRKLEVAVTFPEGGSFTASDPEPASVKKVSTFTYRAVIDFGEVAPSERPEVAVEYRWPVIWSAFRPLEWALLAAGVIAVVYILRRRRVEEKRPAEAKRSDLDQFLSLYKERIALLAELEELERGVEGKKVGRERFNRRSAEITRRRQELLRTLRRLAGRLEASDPRLSDRLHEIRDAEAEVEQANADLKNLGIRLRTRRISRRDYERRRRDCLRRRSQAQRSIEQAIAALQAEA